SPLAVGPGQQVVFQELLVLLQRRRRRLRGFLQLRGIRSLADHLQQAAFVKGDGATVLAQGRVEEDVRRVAQALPGRREDARDLADAAGDVLDDDRLRQGGLNQRKIDAVADVFVVNTGVLLERPRVLLKPKASCQVLLEDFKID